MATPFIGEIRIMAFDYAPLGWAQCSGQILSIAQNNALFSLLGTTYGGNGINTFALPDLRSRAPLHFGQGVGLSSRTLGQQSGTESVSLTTQQIPPHTHAVNVSNAPGTQTAPAGGYFAAHRGGYGESGSPMSGGVLASSGSSVPHPNLAPYLVVNFCIALQGIYPSATGTPQSSPFLAEARLFAFDFAPSGWAACSGQIISIQQNTALFSLLGTTFGGNGTTNFGLPDFKSRVPLHSGAGPGLTSKVLGETGGTETVRLITAEMAAHSHLFNAGHTTPLMEGGVPGASPARGYGSGPPNATADSSMVQPAGGNEAHDNMPPFLALNFCIAMQGVFPSRN
jgi:microcystin-dependent protein